MPPFTDEDVMRWRGHMDSIANKYLFVDLRGLLDRLEAAEAIINLGETPERRRAWLEAAGKLSASQYVAP